jgi:hypothetical protein
MDGFVFEAQGKEAQITVVGRPTFMRLRTTSIAGLAGVMLAVGAPVAIAQSTPVQNGYSTPAGEVQTQVENNTPKQNSVPAAETSTPKATVQQPAASSQLPFTGLDVGFVLAAGAVLLAAGFGIRRVTRPTGSV